MITIAINGFGRIGRTFLRALYSDKKASSVINVAVINIGPARIDMVANMFTYDTLMGIYPGHVALEGTKLIIDNHTIQLVAQTDPLKINWKQFNIDWVVESSGAFTKREKALKHLDAGAGHVLITAPAHDEDVAIIPGVNNDAYNPAKDRIVSLGSCTTNALIPTLKVLHDSCGIVEGFMTTIHAYTNTQVLLDVETSDPRRSRAAALNIIPTSTGASDMLDKIIPSLKGKIQSVSIRVPVAKVSLIDLVFRSQKKITKAFLNDLFKKASETSLKGIVGYTDKELVSSDFSGNNHSVIIDSKLTEAHETMGKIFGWYDNEWGYSMRLVDFLMMVAHN